ncbi:hypothetical protein B0H10DRAFT_2163979 [Mycena sp. CBHHK59/15]|nr:hypothetical protein B0H10DRAFT_2163979 [Mycena sp. CBHHK59/15]
MAHILVPPLIINDVPQAFLELCKPGVEVATQLELPVSLSSTLVSQTTSDSDKPKDGVDQTRLTKNYADAYTDTNISGRGFVRELRPINGHPIEPVWDDILTRIEEYLKGAKLPFTAVMPLGFTNEGEEKPFCPLVVAIGVEPEKVAFEDATAVAEHVKLNILAEADFDDDDVTVALWEFETFLSSSGPKLPTLDPELHGHLTKFHHPFTSALGTAVAPLKQPGYEGSLGAFLTRGDGTELLALTAAHGLSLKAADRRHQEMVVLGNEAYTLAIKKIQTEVGHLQQSINTEELRAQGLRGRLDNGAADANGTIAAAIRTAEQNVEISKESIRQLNLLHSRVTQFMPIPDNRCIGRVLFADPIGASSDGPDAYTRDWAVVGIRKDAFGDDFQGNILYIGDALEEQTFLDHMFPHVADREGYAYPEHGLLRIRGVVPLDDILHPKRLDVNGDPAMAVVKHGRTTGTTVGWMSRLKSLVRYYQFINIEFTSRELTVVPYDNKPGRGAFSDQGDSGSLIVERGGRAIALLTGGGGITDATDVTFASPYCELEKRVKDIFPGIRLRD